MIYEGNWRHPFETMPFRFSQYNRLGFSAMRGGHSRGVYSHKWPIWVCAAPNPPLFTLTRSQTPHYLPWPVRWTPIFLSLSVRSPHKIYRDSFIHRELWNYLSLVGNWLFRTLVCGAQNVSDCTTEHLNNTTFLGEAPQTPLTWGGHPLPHDCLRPVFIPVL